MKNNILRQFRSASNRETELFAFTLLVLAICLGIVVRWNFISHADFPINDGGFFFQMIVDLIDNGFRIPDFTNYNQANIPFAYPPLSFYITGAIKELTNISLMDLLHYLPFVFNVLTIPVFFLFTKTFFEKDLILRSFATLIFATLPRSFEWFIMGGGLTRSLGFLFAVIALLFISKFLRDDTGWSSVVLASIFTGLTVLSHPVASLFLGFSAVILFIYYWPGKLLKTIVMGLGAVLITSPWWIKVFSVHGLAPFIGATNTGHVDWFEIKYLLTLNFEYENRFFLPVVSILAILGLFSESKKKALFLGLLAGLGYLFIPRGGIDLLTVYMALLATLGFELIIEKISGAKGGDQSTADKKWIYSNKPRILLFGLVIYTFLGAYTYKFVDGKIDLHLDQENFEAMTWLKEHTPNSSKVIVMPSDESHRNWPNDYLGEWLPVVAARESLGTVQGYEWLPALFSERIYQYVSLRSCTSYGIECIESWLEQYDKSADYIYIGEKDTAALLMAEFTASNLELVYENEKAVIFKAIAE